mgnify:CR=1 FL=1
MSPNSSHPKLTSDAVVAEGRVRTYDMLKLRGGAQAVAQGAATTSQMTDAIIGKL